jgi:hypothetical protein
MSAGPATAHADTTPLIGTGTGATASTVTTEPATEQWVIRAPTFAALAVAAAHAAAPPSSTSAAADSAAASAAASTCRRAIRPWPSMVTAIAAAITTAQTVSNHTVAEPRSLTAIPPALTPAGPAPAA